MTQPSDVAAGPPAKAELTRADSEDERTLVLLVHLSGVVARASLRSVREKGAWSKPRVTLDDPHHGGRLVGLLRDDVDLLHEAAHRLFEIYKEIHRGA